MIPTVKEGKELKVYEKCCFCKASTDMWNIETNQPVCNKCAKVHDISELPGYKPKVYEYLKF